MVNDESSPFSKKVFVALSGLRPVVPAEQLRSREHKNAEPAESAEPRPRRNGKSGFTPRSVAG